MASIPKTTANTNAQIELDAITAAANQAFIDEVDAIVLQAIDQGKFYVNCVANKEVDPQAIALYYANLGYGISFPDCPQSAIFNPSNLFGECWEAYWANGFVPKRFKEPYRILISFC